MGGKETKPEPPPPQKTVKEMVKEFSKTINKLKRDFGKEISKLEMQNKQVKVKIEQMIKKKESKNSIRILAQQLLKNNGMITRYQRLDAQMGDVLFQLNTAASTDVLVKVMTGMGQVMKQSNQQIDAKNIQRCIEQFNIETEKQTIMMEQIQDVMDDGENEINDEAADQLILQMEKDLGGGGNGGNLVNKENNVNQMDDFDKRLNDLKE